MARIKRGTGRDALIEATAEVLLAGDEVQVKHIADMVGVSHTLIYRHFPTGGKEELIAEGYAAIFRGVAVEDFSLIFNALVTPGDRRARLREVLSVVLSPRRGGLRWARLAALTSIRTNPYVEDLIDESRKELIQIAADQLVALPLGIDARRARTIALVAQAIPLGLTAIGGVTMRKADREAVVDLWTDTFLHWLHGASGAPR